MNMRKIGAESTPPHTVKAESDFQKNWAWKYDAAFLGKLGGHAA